MLSQVVSLTEASLSHSTSERPKQVRTSGTQPPRVACSAFPSLGSVPETVVTLRWLVPINQPAFARTIQANGKLTSNREDDSVSPSVVGTLGHLLGERREVLGHLAASRTHPVGSKQGLVWKDEAFRGRGGADRRKRPAAKSSRICAPILGSLRVGCGRVPAGSRARREQAPASAVSCS
jgi:hypothetical protein